MKPKGQIAKWKIEEVEKLAKLMKEYPVIGIIDMTSFPSKQLLKMKKLLKEKAMIRMAKKSLIQRALEKVGRKELMNYIEGQPALLLTKENPFAISKILIENKANAPAKPNSIVPKEIIIPAGETGFSPGPIVGELQKIGINAGIERGKVVVREESVIAKAGERIDEKKAGIMNKLGIEPIELKLRLIAAYENGMIFGEEALGITPAQVLEWLKNASLNTFNLTFKLGYTTKYNVKFFLQKVYRETKAVAIKANYTCTATVKELLAKADAQAKALKEEITEAPAEEKKEVSEKPKEAEEKKEKGATKA